MSWQDRADERIERCRACGSWTYDGRCNVALCEDPSIELSRDEQQRLDQLVEQIGAAGLDVAPWQRRHLIAIMREPG